MPLLLVLGTATSCGESTVEQAERHYHFLQQNDAGEPELCTAAKKVARALVDEGKSLDYRAWDARGELHCTQAKLDRL